MDGVDLLRTVAESELEGKPLSPSATRFLMDAVLVHLQTGESVDRALGLSGEKRSARFKLQQQIMDEALFEAYTLISKSDRLGELVEMVTIFQDAPLDVIPENAGEVYLALHRAFSTDLTVPSSRNRLRDAIDRHLARIED